MTFNSEWVGYIAGFITTVCFMPQAFTLVKNRKTDEISLLSYCLYFAGIALWLVYGLFLGSTPIILFNAIALLPTAVIIITKLKFG